MANVLRRAGLGVVTLGLTGMLCITGTGLAQADPLTLDEAKAQLAQYEADSSAIAEQYAQVQVQQEESQQQLAKAQSDAATQAVRVTELRTQVGAIALHQYRAQGLDVTTKLLTSQDVEGFLSQMSTVQKVTDNTNSLLQSYQAAQANLADLQRTAQAQSEKIAADEARLADLVKQAEAKVTAAENVVNRLTAEQRRKLEAERAAAAAAAAAAAPPAPAAPAAAPAAPAAPAQAAPPPASGRAGAAIAFARSQVGKRYSMGSMGPNAYDCSGLTSVAFRQAGISLPRTSQSQYRVGTPVSMSQLQPGDLVFYYRGISHVGIYIGGGMIVHAANPRSGVGIASVSSMPFMGGRRVA